MEFADSKEIETYWEDGDGGAMFDILIKEAPYIPGDDGSICRFEDIPWANPALIAEGKTFFRENRFAITMAHLCSLIYGFAFKSLTTVLVRTGGFGLGNPEQSLIRHFTTGKHINGWYENDLKKVYKDIQFVRKLHFNALRKCDKIPLRFQEDNIPDREDKLKLIQAVRLDLDEGLNTDDSPTELFTYTPDVLISQFDMVATLFGFTLLIALYPKQLGIRKTQGIREKKIELSSYVRTYVQLVIKPPRIWSLIGIILVLTGFLHYWSLIAKMLGVEDRFNTALHPNRDLYYQFFLRLGMASLKDMDLTIIHIQQTYVDAISPSFGFITLKSILYAGMSHLSLEIIPEVKGKHLWSILSWKDVICFKMGEYFTFLLYHSDLARTSTNAIYKMSYNRDLKQVLGSKTNTRKNKLQIQYQNAYVLLKWFWSLLEPYYRKVKIVTTVIILLAVVLF